MLIIKKLYYNFKLLIQNNNPNFKYIILTNKKSSIHQNIIYTDNFLILQTLYKLINNTSTIEKIIIIDLNKRHLFENIQSSLNFYLLLKKQIDIEYYYS